MGGPYREEAREGGTPLVPAEGGTEGAGGGRAPQRPRGEGRPRGGGQLAGGGDGPGMEPATACRLAQPASWLAVDGEEVCIFIFPQ